MSAAVAAVAAAAVIAAVALLTLREVDRARQGPSVRSTGRQGALDKVTWGLAAVALVALGIRLALTAA